MNTQPKPAKAIDLSEYAEEAVPFDTVMRQILKAKPVHRVAKPKPAAKQKRK
jgi:hypothetical protein